MASVMTCFPHHDLCRRRRGWNNDGTESAKRTSSSRPVLASRAMWGHRAFAQPVVGMVVLVTAVAGCARSVDCPDLDPASILTVAVKGDLGSGPTIGLGCEGRSCSAVGETVTEDGVSSRSFDFSDEPSRATVTVESPDGTVLFERMTGIEWEEVNPRSPCPTGSIAQISLEAP